MARQTTPIRSFPLIISLVAMVISCLYLQLAAADEVVMRNGDRLTGKVVRTDRSTLRLETDYASTLNIDWAKVQNVRFDEPRKVVLDDETEGMVAEMSREAGQITLQKDGASPSISVAPSRVRVIEPEPWETDEGYKLTGRINAALKSENGNNDENDIDIDYEIDYRRRRHRFESFGEFEYDTNRGAKSTDKWFLSNKYSRLFRGPWYAAGSLFFRP